MRTEKVLEQLQKLPPEAQREVADFVEFLRARHVPGRTRRAKRKGALSREPFIGMWRDRDDMKDSGEWVRRLRAGQWARGRE
jgi:hypothetical protein